ncbi:MAG: response regulator [Chloroflexi bacterium]|nr:response regulator [Chloroflexota bacterium]
MPEKILIVDDEYLNLDLLALTLQTAGYHVVKARDGHQALDLAAHIDLDAIVLDVMMPELSGYDVLRRLKQSRRPLPPVIFLSAKGQIEDMVEGMELGAFRYLVKPISREKLLETIKAALESRKSR